MRPASPKNSRASPAARPRLELQTGHSAPVSSVAFSPDGTTLASGSYDRTVILWDLRTGRMRRRLLGHRHNVGTVAFSPSGESLASGDCTTVRLWDGASGEWRRTLTGICEPWVFSSDGRFLIAQSSYDVTVIKWWDLETGETRRIRASPEDSVNAISLSLDGTTMATASYREVRIWDPQTGELKRCCRVPARISWWERDASTGTWRQVRSEQGDLTAIALSPDGRTLAVGGRWALWLCDTRTGRRTRLFPFGGAHPLTFTPDGKRLVAGTGGGAVKLWNVRTGELDRSFVGHTEWVAGVACSADGRTVASASHDRTVRVWRADTGECRHRLAGQEAAVGFVAFSPDGAVLASGHSDATIRFWNARTGALERTLTGDRGSVRCLAFSPDGRTLASGGRRSADASSTSEVRLWDLSSGRPLRILGGSQAGITSLAFSAMGHLLAVGYGGHHPAARVWDMTTGRLKRTFERRNGRGSTLITLSPDGSILASASGWPNEIRLRDVETGELIRRLPEPEEHEPALSLCFSPDGKTLASGHMGFRVALWDVATGELRQLLRTHEDFLDSLAISADGATLAVGGEYGAAVGLWDLRQGVERRILEGHTDNIRSLAFSPDGRHLASAAADGSVKLWDAVRGRLIVTLLVLPASDGKIPREWIAFTPAGYYDASPGAGPFIRWRVGDDLYGAEVYRSTFHRPDRVERLLQ
jgi:WD40 repeat protein